MPAARFDLDKAIATWRRTYAHRRVLFREDLDELETHLRDHVDWLRAEGYAEEQAFRIALRKVGAHPSTEAAYRRVFLAKLKHRRSLLRETKTEIMMLKNYAKVALRNLMRDRFYAFLNVLGLVVGLTSFLVLAVLVHNELTYDRFHDHPENVYRLTNHIESTDHNVYRYALVSGHIDGILEADVPDLEASTAFLRVQSDMVLRQGDHAFTEQRGFFTDADFGKVFTFQTVRGGDLSTMLQRPGDIVLTESMARKYFGAEDPVGQTMEWVEGEDDSVPLTVTGILKDLPVNSHLQFDFLLAGSTMGNHWQKSFFGEKAFPQLYLYFRMKRPMSVAAVQGLVDAATRPWRVSLYGERFFQRGGTVETPVQRLTDVYFHADNNFEATAGGNITYVEIMAVVALFMLLVAGINYVNLATARSVRRASEVGVRKVLGASPGGLIGQFMLEAVLVAVLAAVASIGLAEVALRNVVPALLGYRLSLVAHPWWIVSGMGIGLILGVLAGSIPAYATAGFHVVEVLKGKVEEARQGVFSLRGMLVALQFTVTLSLLMGALVVLRQLDYLRDKGLGYRRENVLVIDSPSVDGSDGWEAFHDAIKAIPGVEAVATSTYTPISDYNSAALVLSAAGTEKTVPILWNLVDYDYLPTMGLDLVQGRNFSMDFPADDDAIIVNEAAARAIGVDDPTGMKVHLTFLKDELSIIGVVRDFHFQSFNNAIVPVVLRLNPAVERRMEVRLSGSNTRGTLDRLSAAWKASGMLTPFDYTFLDDTFQQLIEKERRLGSVMTLFTLITILIACLGLVGLVSYVTERRRKEIGIRKVVGATRMQIIALINRRFVGAVVVAFAVAVPVAWWGIDQWLAGFAYRIAVAPADFAVAGAMILIVAVLTVSMQSFRAASADPVKSLRHE